jgi:DNA-binding NtrC family response regulator
MHRSDHAPLLLVEDNASVLEATKHLLAHEGWERLETAATGQEALDRVNRKPFSVILFDLGLPDLPGETVFAGLKEKRPETPIIIVTAQNDLDTAVKFMREGAFDYVVKGGEPIRLTSAVDRAFQYYRKSIDLSSLQESLLSSHLKNPEVFADIITANERVKNVLRLAEAVSPSDEAVLITGETGVGKEILARDIHKCSGRAGSFVAFNAGALDEPMFDDTLFGHVKGAFTGADQVRRGFAATADGGTLFLDEVGDLRPQSQVKLLRFLESREYFPLGSDLPRRSSARVIAATNVDLSLLVERGSFRKDLLYRLSSFHLVLPPLRERPEDIPLIGRHLLKTLDDEGGRTTLLTSEAWDILTSLPFSGNVRELRQVLLRSKMASPDGTVDRALLEALGYRASASPHHGGNGVLFPETLPTVREVIEALIREALHRSGGKQNAAGALIGLSPQAMSKRVRSHKD